MTYYYAIVLYKEHTSDNIIVYKIYISDVNNLFFSYYDQPKIIYVT